MPIDPFLSHLKRSFRISLSTHFSVRRPPSGVPLPCANIWRTIRHILMILRGRAVYDPKRFWASYMVIKCLICVIYSENPDYNSGNIVRLCYVVIWMFCNYFFFSGMDNNQASLAFLSFPLYFVSLLFWCFLMFVYFLYGNKDWIELNWMYEHIIWETVRCILMILGGREGYNSL